jgi:hypothetical protein
MEDVLCDLVVVVVILKLVLRRENSSESLFTEGGMVIGGADVMAKSLPAARDLKMTTLLTSLVVDLVVLVGGDAVEHPKCIRILLLESLREFNPLLVRIAPRVEDRKELVCRECHSDLTRATAL